MPVLSLNFSFVNAYLNRLECLFYRLTFSFVSAYLNRFQCLFYRLTFHLLMPVPSLKATES